MNQYLTDRYRAIFLGTALLLIAACGSVPEPTPLPTAEVAETPTAAAADTPTLPPDSEPTATPTEPPVEPTSEPPTEATLLRGALADYTITIPAGWRSLMQGDGQIAEIVAALAAENTGGPLTDSLRNFVENAGAEHLDIIAWDAASADAGMPASLTILVVPRNGMELASYLTAIEAEVGEGTLDRAEIDRFLREDSRPVATLQHTTPGTPFGLAASSGVTTYQAALFDKLGDQMIILNFSAASARFGAMLPEFQKVVQSLIFPDS